MCSWVIYDTTAAQPYSKYCFDQAGTSTLTPVCHWVVHFTTRLDSRDHWTLHLRPLRPQSCAYIQTVEDKILFFIPNCLRDARDQDSLVHTESRHTRVASGQKNVRLSDHRAVITEELCWALQDQRQDQRGGTRQARRKRANTWFTTHQREVGQERVRHLYKSGKKEVSVFVLMYDQENEALIKLRLRIKLVADLFPVIYPLMKFAA